MSAQDEKRKCSSNNLIKQNDKLLAESNSEQLKMSKKHNALSNIDNKSGQNLIDSNSFSKVFKQIKNKAFKPFVYGCLCLLIASGLTFLKVNKDSEWFIQFNGCIGSCEQAENKKIT